MKSVYNLENGFPAALSDILDNLNMAIDYKREDEDSSEKGYGITVYYPLPNTGVDWYNNFLLQEGTLQELVDSIKKYVADYKKDAETDWILSFCSGETEASQTFAKDDAGHMLCVLKRFLDDIEKAYPSLSNDILVNDNLITDKKIEAFRNNFKDNEDIIRIFFDKFANLQDKLDFIDIIPAQIVGNIDDYIEETLMQMPEEEIDSFAAHYCMIMMSDKQNAISKPVEDVEMPKKIHKYTFEYKFSSGLDIEITPEEAQRIESDKRYMHEKIDDAVLDFDCGEANYEGEGEYPEVLRNDDGSLYIHTRVYGNYETNVVGTSYEKCGKSAFGNYECANLGDFTIDDGFVNEGKETFTLKPDCVTFLEYVKGCFSKDTVAGINLDECGYSVKAEITDISSHTVDLEIYKRDENHTFSEVHTPVTEQQVYELYAGSEFICDFKNISFDKCKDIVTNLVLGGIELVNDEIKREKKDKSNDFIGR